MLSWVYNRIKLSQRFNPNLITDLSNSKPTKFPVYIRSIDTRINYTRKANNLEDITESDGYVAQVALDGGKVIFSYRFEKGILTEQSATEHGVEIGFRSKMVELAAKQLLANQGEVIIAVRGGLIVGINIVLDNIELEAD